MKGERITLLENLHVLKKYQFSKNIKGQQIDVKKAKLLLLLYEYLWEFYLNSYSVNLSNKVRYIRCIKIITIQDYLVYSTNNIAT